MGEGAALRPPGATTRVSRNNRGGAGRVTGRRGHPRPSVATAKLRPLQTLHLEMLAADMGWGDSWWKWVQVWTGTKSALRSGSLWGAQPAQFVWFSHCGCPAFQFAACYQDPCASGLVQSSTPWLGTVPWPPSPAFVPRNAQGSQLPSESPPGRSRGLLLRP